MSTIAAEYRTPLEWTLLWNAMRGDYALSTFKNREPRLIPTTENMADEMLCVVPPRSQSYAGFLVGESNHHDKHGRAVYAAFIKIGETWFARYATAEQFRAI